jgi:uncharacterized membrane protein
MSSLSFTLFSLGVFAVFLLLLRNASKLGSFFVYILVLGSLYDYVTELIGVNISSTYYYGPFFLRICTGGGSLEPPADACSVPNHCIPVAVILMEACILLTVIRTTDLLAPPSWVKPFLDAAISVNIDIMLDPITSTSSWCDQGVGDSFGGLGFWTWVTSADFPGHWFGVPLFNYVSWYADTLAFVIAIRLVMYLYLEHRTDAFSAFKGALMTVGLLIPLEGVINLSHTAVFHRSSSASWQWTVALLIAAFNVVIVAATIRRFRFDSPPEWPLVSASAFLFAFGLGHLLWAPSLSDQRGPLLVVWAVTFVVNVAYYVAPYGKWLWRSRTGEPAAA